MEKNIPTEVVCKFKCDKISLTTNGTEVTLSPVVSGSIENQEFFNFTPYGTMVFGSTNALVGSVFMPGGEYFVNIKKA